MARSVGAILLAVVVLTANTAWCQPGMSTTRPTEGWGNVEPVPVQTIKVGAWHVIEAGVRMALAREAFDSIWPNYAYKIDPASDFLDITCQILRGMPEQLAEDTIILKSNVDFSNADLNDEFQGFGLEALAVCSSKEREPFDSVWPSYAYEINTASDNLDGIRQFLDGMQFARDPMILSSNVDFGNADFSAEFQRFGMDALIDQSLNAKHNYLVIDVTENPVPSLEPTAQIWLLGEQDFYNYFVTENPVPSLELAARVKLLGEQDFYFVAGHPAPSPEKLGEENIPNFIVE